MQFAKDLFLESLARCSGNGSFAQLFYTRLFDSSDEIEHRFRFTDMDRQYKLLSQALKLCGDAVAGDPDGLAAVRELGKSHDIFHHNIRPEWYPLWLDAICATVAETDPKWNDEIESAWRTVLQHVINRMLAMYHGDRR